MTPRRHAIYAIADDASLLISPRLFRYAYAFSPPLLLRCRAQRYDALRAAPRALSLMLLAVLLRCHYAC